MLVSPRLTQRNPACSHGLQGRPGPMPFLYCSPLPTLFQLVVLGLDLRQQVHPWGFTLPAPCLSSLPWALQTSRCPSGLYLNTCFSGAPFRVTLSEKHLPLLNFFLPRTHLQLPFSVFTSLACFCFLCWNGSSVGSGVTMFCALWNSAVSRMVPGIKQVYKC